MGIIRIIKKFMLILSPHQKLRIVELSVLMVIAGFLEMLSVSLMLPFMKAVLSPDELMSNSFVFSLCNILGIQSHRTLMVLLAFIMAAVFIFKNIFLMFQLLVQNRFTTYNRFFVQKILLRDILKSSYEEYLDLKSGDVIQLITQDTTAVFNTLNTLLSLFAEMVVSFSLIITVFVVSPSITLAVAVVMLLVVGVSLSFLKPRIKRLGIETRQSLVGLQQWLIQTVQGFKEIKICRTENYFENEFNYFGNRFVGALYRFNTLSAFPRFFTESFSLGSFFIIIGIMIYKGAELELLIPILSVVAMAAIRLIPSSNRIITSISNITFSEPSIDKLIERLEKCKLSTSEKELAGMIDSAPISQSSVFSDSILMDRVFYSYPSGNANVLNGATIEIKKGQSVGIVGASGSGKTTAVDILLGLLVPQRGEIKVDGVSIYDDVNGWLNKIGYIPQNIFILDADIRKNVAFGVEETSIDDNRVKKALHEAALDEYIENLPNGIYTELGERGTRLSGGQRQRIGIARALYFNPEILFFDEATSALDNETEKEIMKAIEELQGTKTMIIIAHRLNTIEKCNVIYRIENGLAIKEKDISYN